MVRVLVTPNAHCYVVGRGGSMAKENHCHICENFCRNSLENFCSEEKKNKSAFVNSGNKFPVYEDEKDTCTLFVK
jgi:recombinational DNA repair protein RecR